MEAGIPMFSTYQPYTDNQSHDYRTAAKVDEEKAKSRSQEPREERKTTGRSFYGHSSNTGCNKKTLGENPVCYKRKGFCILDF